MTTQPADQSTFLGEGRVLLHYVMGQAPLPEMATLYSQGLEAAGRRDVLSLRFWERRCPGLLWFRDVSTVGIQTEFQARLKIAALVVECFPSGTRDVYDYTGRGRLACLADIALVCILEGLPFLGRVAYRLLVRENRS